MIVVQKVVDKIRFDTDSNAASVVYSPPTDIKNGHAYRAHSANSDALK